MSDLKQCQEAVNDIIMAALSGTDLTLRYNNGGGSYIRWGLIEERINKTIAAHWPDAKETI